MIAIAGQHHRADLWVVVAAVGYHQQFAGHLGGERVARLRAVEADQADLAVNIEGEATVGHGSAPRSTRVAWTGFGGCRTATDRRRPGKLACCRLNV